MSRGVKPADPADRYKQFGGIAGIVRGYAAGELSFASVADAIGVSRQTVSNDVRREIGAGRLSELAAVKSGRYRRRSEPARLDIPAARERIAALTRAADGPGRAELEILSRVLGEMYEAGVPLTVRFGRRGAIGYELKDGRCVGIRVAAVDGSLPEHGRGFHRFNTRGANSRCPVAVFALGVGDEVLPFVFNVADLGDVRSLNLRFTNEGKYSRVRKSKYDAALRDWRVLTGKGRRPAA